MLIEASNKLFYLSEKSGYGEIFVQCEVCVEEILRIDPSISEEIDKASVLWISDIISEAHDMLAQII